MEPWIVVGWETGVTEKTGREFYRVHVERDASAEIGFGKEVNRLFYYPEYVEYKPAIGDQIVTVDGRFGIDKIIKFGNINGA